MASHHRHHTRLKKKPTALEEMWHDFWYQPEGACPKCGSTSLCWYDPFFFSPVRTLTGRRRIKCTACRFVWRRSRSESPSKLTLFH